MFGLKPPRHISTLPISESPAARSDDRNEGKGRIRNAAGWRPLNLGLLTTPPRRGTVQRPHRARTGRWNKHARGAALGDGLYSGADLSC